MPKDTKDTSLDLAALERLLAEATPGRWSHRSKLEDGTPCCDVIGDSDDDWSIVATGNPDLFDMRDADASLIVAAVNALPALIAAARERDKLEAVVLRLRLSLNDATTEYREAEAERDALRAEVERLREVVAAVTTLRPRDEWHEDDGNVVWWTLPVEEPPYVGTLLDDDIPDYVTHWTRLIVPALDAAKEGAK